MGDKEINQNIMNVSTAYKEYMTPKNLQEHMLRVAALSEIITENWTGKAIGGVSIAQAGTLHDIAKPMNFNLAKQAQFGMSQEDIDRLEQLQNHLRSEFGDDEHQVTVSICKKVGCDPKVVELVDNLEWSYIPKLLDAGDVESLILIYCDMRIGLKGILSLEERLEDLKSRESADDYKEKEKNGRRLEELIAKNVSIDLNLIGDNEINEKFNGLLEMPLNSAS